MTEARAATLAAIRALAVGIHEPTREENIARLLERIAASEHQTAERMRAALVEVGAMALMNEAEACT
jgi:hypothetical protein